MYRSLFMMSVADSVSAVAAWVWVAGFADSAVFAGHLSAHRCA